MSPGAATGVSLGDVGGGWWLLVVVGGWLSGVGCSGEVGGEVEWISDGRISVVFEWITKK